MVEEFPLLSSLSDLLVFPSDQRSLYFMRHGRRPEIIDPAEGDSVRLTPEGVIEAEEGGRGLIDCGVVSFHHSPIIRCGETVQALIRGMGISGKRVYEDGELGLHCLKDGDLSWQIAKERGLDSEGFVRAWFADEVTDQAVVPLEETVGRLLRHIRKSLLRGEPGLQIHVSHDWNILALLVGGLGIPLSQVRWPLFLDGILFRLEGEEVVVTCRDLQKSEGFPAWRSLTSDF
ncbi:histidine phosphatase family protein [Magnetococcales bacterium HHB-1]